MKIKRGYWPKELFKQRTMKSKQDRDGSKGRGVNRQGKSRERGSRKQISQRHWRKDAVGVNEWENCKSLNEKMRCLSKFSEMSQFQTDKTQSVSLE